MSETLVIPTVDVADIELPEELHGLRRLAYNLWWTWSPEAVRLFAAIDPEAWEMYRNPVQLLINVEPSEWGRLLESPEFVARYGDVMARLDAYLEGGERAWFAREHSAEREGLIAYFSMEYGLHASLAIYSGGLGVLSGDHAKTASDLGLPFVGVGLLYRHGYFRQTVDAEGLQQHTYPDYDLSRLPVRPAAAAEGGELRVEVPLPGREVSARVWVAQVGRVPVLLLDTDVPENDPADRPITGILYVSGREMRLAQEVVAGIGGVRALEALGIEPAVWHINEGHCALLQLERLIRELDRQPATLAAGLAKVRRDAVFTTHTPVPAGNEIFDASVARPHLEGLAERLGVGAETLAALGDAGRGDAGTFNMTALALRTSRTANAVSRLNAEVSAEMWSALTASGEAPEIQPITNGVHVPTWVGPEMEALFRRSVGEDWPERLLDREAWEAILQLPDAELWRAHEQQKERLGRFVRSRVLRQLARHGRSPEELRRVGQFFDPSALTIGFARRFATYKRAKLAFSDLDRLRALLADTDRPLQFLFAGKAHPADRPGQELIQQIFELSQGEGRDGTVVFLEDYDMEVGRMMVQGVDLWLNTPRRPMEASGTSGQKAALNGVLNFSILDGWWPEAFDGSNGWAIRAESEGETEAEQDRLEADALYSLLEDEILPTFHDRGESGLPERWIAMMKRSIALVTPHFSSSRMVRDYVELSYLA